MLCDKKHIPRPASGLRAALIPNFCSIPELITEFVRAFRFTITQFQFSYSQIRQAVQLACFTDAVVICILPQTQIAENRVPIVNHTIRITAAERFVVFSQGEKTVLLLRAEQAAACSCRTILCRRQSNRFRCGRAPAKHRRNQHESRRFVFSRRCL